MSTFERTQKPAQEIKSADPLRSDEALSGQSCDAVAFLRLQRSLGNHAVQSLLRLKAQKPGNRAGLAKDIGACDTRLQGHIVEDPPNPESTTPDLTGCSSSIPTDFPTRCPAALCALPEMQPKDPVVLVGGGPFCGKKLKKRSFDRHNGMQQNCPFYLRDRNEEDL